MLDTSQGGWTQDQTIHLARLEAQLGVEGFRVPPLSDKSGNARLPIERFPSWLFCPNCRLMHLWDRGKAVALKDGELPRCSKRGCRGTILVPMRYVAACENGHITDVDWFRWAHSRSDGAKGKCDPHDPKLYFEAKTEGGSSLEALVIRCERCRSQRHLGTLQSRDALKSIGQNCPGLQPWQPARDRWDCRKSLVALLRSQTAVHYSDVVSAIDLTLDAKPVDERFEEEIRKRVETLIDDEGFASLEHFVDDGAIEKLAQNLSRKLSRAVSEDEVAAWISRFFGAREGGKVKGDKKQVASKDIVQGDLLAQEWPVLTTPTRDRGRAAPLIVTNTKFPGDDDVLGGLIRSVFLIERLREVRALRGFRRVEPAAHLVGPHLGNPWRWLPATEVYGEGIFLVLDIKRIRAWEERYEAGLKSRSEKALKALQSDKGVELFRLYQDFLPRAAMVHTFSHILMRQLCYECGYHAASLRERLYVFDDKAGILIYTADGDSEGSLGGLVRQGHTERITNTIRSAIERASWCSNDPICSELPEHGVGGLSRAACHACALVPETSCTHINSLLDRKLLVEASPSSEIRGYFADLLE